MEQAEASMGAIWHYELAWHACHYKAIAGVDEAGRGAWAGPVVAAAVILGPWQSMWGRLRDSKLLLPAQRTTWWYRLREQAQAVSIGWRSSSVIDQIGIVAATQASMRDALRRLSPSPQVALIDGTYVPQVDAFQTPLIRGEQRSASIAAASIVAKVVRDDLLQRMDKQVPQYHFAVHKGYGTPQHRQALQSAGVSRYHRRSYAPVQRFL